MCPERGGEEIPGDEESGCGSGWISTRGRRWRSRGRGERERQNDGAEEEEQRPESKSAEGIERFSGAEEGNDQRECGEERNGADAEMFYIVEAAQEPAGRAHIGWRV